MEGTKLRKSSGNVPASVVQMDRYCNTFQLLYIHLCFYVVYKYYYYVLPYVVSFIMYYIFHFMYRTFIRTYFIFVYSKNGKDNKKKIFYITFIFLYCYMYTKLIN